MCRRSGIGRHGHDPLEAPIGGVARPATPAQIPIRTGPPPGDLAHGGDLVSPPNTPAGPPNGFTGDGATHPVSAVGLDAGPSHRRRARSGWLTRGAARVGAASFLPRRRSRDRDRPADRFSDRHPVSVCGPGCPGGDRGDVGCPDGVEPPVRSCTSPPMPGSASLRTPGRSCRPGSRRRGSGSAAPRPPNPPSRSRCPTGCAAPARCAGPGAVAGRPAGGRPVPGRHLAACRVPLRRMPGGRLRPRLRAAAPAKIARNYPTLDRRRLEDADHW